jgi:hypothetical protein
MSLFKGVKTEIRNGVKWTAAGDSCLRCDQLGHETKDCDAPTEICWKDDRFGDTTEAEELYQAEREKVEDTIAKKKAADAAKKAEKAAKKPAAKQVQAQAGTRIPLAQKPDTMENKAPTSSTAKDDRKHPVKPKTTAIQPTTDQMGTVFLSHRTSVQSTENVETNATPPKTTKQVHIPIDQTF